MLAINLEEAASKRLRGRIEANKTRAKWHRCKCGRQIMPGSGRVQCAQCAKRKGKFAVVPDNLDQIPGDGRCMGGREVAKACGVQWGNLDHRHCACGEAIAAYWLPDLDRTADDEDPEHWQVVEGRCGRCEVRNLPLSQRVWTERAVTEGHLPTPRTTGRARISPPRLATDLASTPRTGGLV